MRPDKLSILRLFEDRSQYLIPLFQRGYVWTLPDQIFPLWEDLIDRADAIAGFKADAEKVGGADKLRALRKHFLGTVVVGSAKGGGADTIPTREVIDAMTDHLGGLEPIGILLEGRGKTAPDLAKAVFAGFEYADLASSELRFGCTCSEVRVMTSILTLPDSDVEAMLDGFRRGSEGTELTIYLICSAMRTAARSLEIAELAVRWRDAGVVGFDIAGAEAGFPPTRHLDAFHYIQRENFHSTIHAGEAFGLPSIWEAIQWCGADRLGHGVRIIDDIATSSEGEAPTLGRLAAYVRDCRIPLEMCPTSNLQTGAADSIAAHPITLLKDLRFRVTVNTDNRLMSGTSMSREMQLLVDEAGWTLADLRWATINAMKSAFIPFDERLELIESVVKPGYAALGA